VRRKPPTNKTFKGKFPIRTEANSRSKNKVMRSQSPSGRRNPEPKKKGRFTTRKSGGQEASSHSGLVGGSRILTLHHKDQKATKTSDLRNNLSLDKSGISRTNGACSAKGKWLRKRELTGAGNHIKGHDPIGCWKKARELCKKIQGGKRGRRNAYCGNSAESRGF